MKLFNEVVPKMVLLDSQKVEQICNPNKTSSSGYQTHLSNPNQKTKQKHKQRRAVLEKIKAPDREERQNPYWVLKFMRNPDEAPWESEKLVPRDLTVVHRSCSAMGVFWFQSQLKLSLFLLHLSPSISMTHIPKTSITPSFFFAKPLGAPRAQAMVLKLNRGATVKCMANQRRVEKVAKQIMREISDMLVTDKVIQSAILPEAAFGADMYLSSLTTVSDVEISNDLQVAKVYVSVFGDDRGKKVAIAGLKAKSKYVRHQLGKRMRLRMSPEVRFIEDDSQERGSRVLSILDKLKEEEDEEEEEWSDEEEEEEEEEEWSDEEEGSKDDDSDEEDEDDEEEDPDKGIIYVD